MSIHDDLLAFRAPPDRIRFRVGATSRDQKRAQALAYVDPRDVQEWLDEIAPGWTVDYRPWGTDKIVCLLVVDGVHRASTGEFDSGDKVSQGPTAEAQAFKRAASAHGLMRYLYDLDAPWVEYDSEKRRLAVPPDQLARRLGLHRAAPRGATASPATPPESTPEPAPPPRAQQAPSGGSPGGDVPIPQGKSAPIGEARGEAMAKKLVGLGYDRGELRSAAASIINEPVMSLGDLTGDEAARVWFELEAQAKRRQAAS